MPPIGAPAIRVPTAEGGITDLGAVASPTETELLDLHGVGPLALQVLRAALAEHGRDLAG